MENPISISNLNDFIFCPISIYFHSLYDGVDRTIYQSIDQIAGTNAHNSVDGGTYSTSKDILQGMSIYSEGYNLVGKIDTYDIKRNTLIERKKKVSVLYDGYVFQVYAQCFALREMGYIVEKIVIHSMDDNKNYDIPLPENDLEMFNKFNETINALNEFEPNEFIQENGEKCARCIYEPYCDRSVSDDYEK